MGAAEHGARELPPGRGRVKAVRTEAATPRSRLFLPPFLLLLVISALLEFIRPKLKGAGERIRIQLSSSIG